MLGISKQSPKNLSSGTKFDPTAGREFEISNYKKLVQFCDLIMS